MLCSKNVPTFLILSQIIRKALLRQSWKTGRGRIIPLLRLAQPFPAPQLPDHLLLQLGGHALEHLVIERGDAPAPGL